MANKTNEQIVRRMCRQLSNQPKSNKESRRTSHTVQGKTRDAICLEVFFSFISTLRAIAKKPSSIRPSCSAEYSPVTPILILTKYSISSTQTYGIAKIPLPEMQCHFVRDKINSSQQHICNPYISMPPSSFILPGLNPNIPPNAKQNANQVATGDNYTRITYCIESADQFKCRRGLERVSVRKVQ